MSILSPNTPSLLDVINVMDPEGGIMTVAEILDQTNDVMQFIPFIEGNLPTGHQSAARTGIPDPTWRSFYGGIQPVKATAAKVTDAAGMMENLAEIDKALADLNGNTNAFRATQDKPILQGMSQAFVSNFFYGNEAITPERFTGLAPRFNSKSAAIQSSQNIIDAGGTSAALTSVWLCVFGESTGFGFYPKGSKGGLQMKDFGEVWIENVDGHGGRMLAYRTHYRWDVGMAIPDWRYFVRIANIDPALLVKDAATGADLIDLMTQAVEQVQDMNGAAVICCNRRIRQYLRRQMVSKIKQSTLTWENVSGKRVMYFDEVPVVRCDALLNTEAQVV